MHLSNFLLPDLPQNCDPNIPLVAQELMKKMIRQFAIEYVSKSRKMHPDSNGILVNDPKNGLQKNHTDGLLLNDQDGPLDLTVTRIQEQTFQDGKIYVRILMFPGFLAKTYNKITKRSLLICVTCFIWTSEWLTPAVLCRVGPYVEGSAVCWSPFVGMVFHRHGNSG